MFMSYKMPGGPLSIRTAGLLSQRAAPRQTKYVMKVTGFKVYPVDVRVGGK